MTVLRFPRRLRSVPPAASDTLLPGGLSAGGQTPWERAGLTHTEFTLRDALNNFQARGESKSEFVRDEHLKSGIINLAHAWLVAVTEGERVNEYDARKLFRELTEAAGAWEQEA
jgi:hypothetical protein